MSHAPFKRITRIANLQDDPRNRGVFAIIRWDGKKLSITGVEGPKSDGNAIGSCGQITMSDWGHYRSTGVDLAKLRDIWSRWHLNDMTAGTPAQEACLRQYRRRVNYPESQFDADKAVLVEHGLQPDNGYSYGSAWLHEDVPADVLAWLHQLPEDGSELPARWH